ncbi:MAG: hypothetical protein WC528_02925 [Patescibacteria group bacterium]
MRNNMLFVMGMIAIVVGVVVLRHMSGFDPWLLVIGVLCIAGGVSLTYAVSDVLEEDFFIFLGIIFAILYVLLKGMEKMVAWSRPVRRFLDSNWRIFSWTYGLIGLYDITVGLLYWGHPLYTIIFILGVPFALVALYCLTIGRRNNRRMSRV